METKLVLCQLLFIPQILVQGHLLQIPKQLGNGVFSFVITLLFLFVAVVKMWRPQLSCILAVLAMFLGRSLAISLFFMKWVKCSAILLPCSTTKAMQSRPQDFSVFSLFLVIILYYGHHFLVIVNIFQIWFMRAGHEELATGIEPIRKEEINYFEWITMHDNEIKETNIQA